MADVVFEQIPTGRTHQINGVYEPILDESGEPETEWALAAVVDGHRVVLQTFSVGYVQHMVGRPDTALEESSTAAEPDAPGSDVEAERQQLLARLAELDAQSGAGNASSSSTTSSAPTTEPAPPAEGAGTANAGDQPPAPTTGDQPQQ